MAKWVYRFGAAAAEGRAEMRDLLGGKGANLAEMRNLGLPVPPGFTITTEVCTAYYTGERTVSVRSGCGMGPVKRISHIEARPHKVLSFCW